MTEAQLKAIPVGTAKGAFVDIKTPPYLKPLRAGDKPLLATSVTIKNAGTIAEYIAFAVYEANADGSDIKRVVAGAVELDPGATRTFTNVAATDGVSKDYPEGSTLYLCFKVWAPRFETEPTCGATARIPVTSTPAPTAAGVKLAPVVCGGVGAAAVIGALVAARR